MDVSTHEPESIAESPLDLEGYRRWALEEGGRGPRRPEDGTAGPGVELSPDSVDADLAILKEFSGLVELRGQNPADPDGMIAVAIEYRRQLETRPPKGPDGRQRAEGHLSALSVERYMVVVRRFFRYAGLLEPKSPRWSDLSGPYVPRSRTMMPATDLDTWFAAIGGRDDKRLELATWLLLSQVPVAALVDLRFGDVDLSNRLLTVGRIKRPIGPELEHLLRSAEKVALEDPLLISQARWHGRGSRAPMTIPGLRSLWNEARLLVSGKGPTMAAVAAAGRHVLVDRSMGESIYVFRDPQPASFTD